MARDDNVLFPNGDSAIGPKDGDSAIGPNNMYIYVVCFVTLDNQHVIHAHCRAFWNVDLYRQAEQRHGAEKEPVKLARKRKRKKRRRSKRVLAGSYHCVEPTYVPCQSQER